MSPRGSGRYRTPIEIRKAVETTDDLGVVTQTWDTAASLVCKDRADFMEQSGREFFAAQAVHSEMTDMLAIRYRSGITPTMRVYYGSRVLDILAVVDTEERHRELILHCREVR